MFKLLKYELRKNRTPLVVMLAVALGLEIYFLIARAAESTRQTYISFSFLALASLFTALTLFALGISSYSRELTQKSSYLTFMVPRSTLSIIASKLVCTLVSGLFFAALFVMLVLIDFTMMMDWLSPGWRGHYNLLQIFLMESGLDLTNFLLTALFYVVLVFLQILATVCVAYAAITLSATFLQNKKGRGFISLVLFVAIQYGLSFINQLSDPQESDVFYSFMDLIPLLVPTLIQDIIVMAVSLFGCAWLLDRHVSL